jgi:protein lifeguard
MLRPGLGPAVQILSLVLSTVAWVIMSISPDARRLSPVKWQILALFTLGEAVSVGFISSFYTFQSVVSAMLTTALATTGVSLYTVLQRNSKYDLSQWGATLSSCGLIFVMYGLIQIFQSVGFLPAGFLPHNDMLYGMIGATLFSFYLAYHTRLIVSGKHTKHQMNEKDYVFGASTFMNLVGRGSG